MFWRWTSVGTMQSGINDGNPPMYASEITNDENGNQGTGPINKPLWVGYARPRVASRRFSLILPSPGCHEKKSKREKVRLYLSGSDRPAPLSHEGWRVPEKRKWAKGRTTSALTYMHFYFLSTTTICSLIMIRSIHWLALISKIAVDDLSSLSKVQCSHGAWIRVISRSEKVLLFFLPSPNQLPYPSVCHYACLKWKGVRLPYLIWKGEGRTSFPLRWHSSGFRGPPHYYIRPLFVFHFKEDGGASLYPTYSV